MVELFRELLFSKAAALGFLIGAIPAFLVYKDNQPTTLWDYLTLALIVLSGGLRPGVVMDAPNIVREARENQP
jgi:hypothetical protein